MSGWKKLWNRVSWIVVIGAVALAIIAFSSSYSTQQDNRTLLKRSIRSGNIHHAETSKQNATIIAQNKVIIALVQTVHNAQETNSGTITAIKNLETEVAQVITQLPAADSALASEATGLANDLMALCESEHADCQPLPAVP